MGQRPPLEYLRTFDCVARHGNFTKAADELNRTQASVSQHVKALETFLGRPLFHRERRGVSLTELGTAYLPSVRAAIADLDLATASLFGARTQRTLTISAPVALNMCLLIPRAREFAAARPGISFNFTSTIWPELSFEQTIAYCHFGTGDWDGMHAEPVTTCTMISVCAPDYRVDDALLTDVMQLVDTTLISVIGFRDAWPKWLDHVGLPDGSPRRWATTDNSMTALEMACHGYGVALVLDIYAAPFIASGRLKRAFPASTPADGRHYLLVSEKLYRTDPLYGEFATFLTESGNAGATG